MTDLIQPKFHHVNLKTTRLQEMIDFYALLVGAEVVDPAAVAADHAAGATFEEIHSKAMSGGYAPAQAPVAVPEPSS
jgi:catechol 2,3-dioxygenase-like lactoylglutathione lyase family enzyme